MEKELYLNDTYKIVSDDLKFDGKTITIPSYWVDSMCEYIKNYNTEGELEADIEDYKLFRNFLWDIQEYKNQGN